VACALALASACDGAGAGPAPADATSGADASGAPGDATAGPDGGAEHAANVDAWIADAPPSFDAAGVEVGGDATTSPGDAAVGPADEQQCRQLCDYAASLGCRPTIPWDCYAGCLRLVATCGDAGRAFNACSARQPPAQWTCHATLGLPNPRPEACPAEEAAVMACLSAR
jgi:hypothetical protein